MTPFLILLSFLLGFTLGKRNFARTKKPPRKAKEISNIRSFLNYDGTERTN